MSDEVEVIILVGAPEPVRGAMQRRCKECQAFVWVQPANVLVVEATNGHFICMKCARLTGLDIFSRYMEQGVRIDNPSESDLHRLHRQLQARAGVEFSFQEMKDIIEDILDSKGIKRVK